MLISMVNKLKESGEFTNTGPIQENTHSQSVRKETPTTILDEEVSFDCGNSSVDVKVISAKDWEKDGFKRVYYELEETRYISSFYKIVSGSVRDLTIEVNGSIFGYKLAQAGASGTKSQNAKIALERLAAKIMDVK